METTKVHDLLTNVSVFSNSYLTVAREYETADHIRHGEVAGYILNELLAELGPEAEPEPETTETNDFQYSTTLSQALPLEGPSAQAW